MRGGTDVTLNNTTVFDDGAADVVGGGGDFDWYFRAGGDVINGLALDELVN
jgi:hypothetical protein